MTKNTEIVIKVSVRHLIWTVISVFFSFSVTFGTATWKIYNIFGTHKDTVNREIASVKSDLIRLDNEHGFWPYFEERPVFRGGVKK